jgi:hypothetical protein
MSDFPNWRLSWFVPTWTLSSRIQRREALPPRAATSTIPIVIALIGDPVASGKFAAYSQQWQSLNLLPWQAPPAHTEIGRDVDEYGGRLPEVTLLQKMLMLGISRYHPDPVAAIAEAAKEAKRSVEA